MAESLRLVQRAIDLAEGDPARGNLIVESPLAQGIVVRGLAGSFLGCPGWKDDLNRAAEMHRGSGTLIYRATAIAIGALVPDPTTLRDMAELLETAEQSGEDFTLLSAEVIRGIVLVHSDDSDRGVGLELLAGVRETAAHYGGAQSTLRMVDVVTAEEKARTGDVDGAIELSRAVIDHIFDLGEMFLRGSATSVLLESLLAHDADRDLHEAQTAIDRLAAVPTDPGFVLHELPLLRLRALLARAHGDEAGYRDYVERYRTMATDLGFEGHMAVANAMT